MAAAAAKTNKTNSVKVCGCELIDIFSTHEHKRLSIRPVIDKLKEEKKTAHADWRGKKAAEFDLVEDEI